MAERRPSILVLLTVLVEKMVVVACYSKTALFFTIYIIYTYTRCLQEAARPTDDGQGEVHDEGHVQVRSQIDPPTSNSLELCAAYLSCLRSISYR